MPAALLLVLLMLGRAGDAVADVAPPSVRAALAAVSLDLVNRARAAGGLAPLAADPLLTHVAQRHAEDMLARGYFAHESPEGGTMMDRFRAAGGDRWRQVAENLFLCRQCGPGAPDSADVAGYHDGWMDSPGHRANILDAGLSAFGFGIAHVPGGAQYAVQAFAGPGRSRGDAGGARGPAVPSVIEQSVLAGLNAERRRAGLGLLLADAGLREGAGSVLAGVMAQTAGGGSPRDLAGLVPTSVSLRWGGIGIATGICGGCGAVPVAADAAWFRQTWLDDPAIRQRLLDPGATAAGFAMTADGLGRKAAVILLGQPR